MIRASGRAAMVVFAGLFLLVGGASQAAPAATNADSAGNAGKSAETEKSTKHRRHAADHRSSKTADKSSDDKANNKKDATANKDAPASDAMPPAVANANAQVASADTPTAAAASAMTDRANDNVQQAAGDNAAPGVDGQVVESNQPNDLDRALQDTPSAQTPVIAATDAQPRPAPVMASSSSDGSAWEQSSLIGKIFIGFGALLTLASAARMFMA
jgi:hypothetical protein